MTLPKHGTKDEATGKPYALQRSGHCQTAHHRTCKWYPRYETPSAIIVCRCTCHEDEAAVRTMKPKGASRKMVAKS